MDRDDLSEARPGCREIELTVFRQHLTVELLVTNAGRWMGLGLTRRRAQSQF